ncbi:6-pyruvoyl-tetrahydropterin synthase related domain / conserved membrane protein [Thermococcus sp. 2319x1]|uniref:6-pyruvoyl-tetrahydropterin synthase-related protein n=1 Tax=Thermococcus sp. 2319x1 TaxID=1674923 RepID=UPI00073ACB8C|nr:6-pyruvoyl-tetrahydropterin synthase-related protein [Thermococcus sp. 2319x1]ALV63707.1 6-pyruvoyl-tetrahydropterin synthase related domain / conserved membrane protein [Thermococcus sp. 2319x1]
MLKIRSTKLREIPFILSVFLLSLVVLRGFLSPGYPPSWGGDSYGHLFKIWKLIHGYKPWIADWYGGYPFLRFYPPLAYFIGVFFGKITSSTVLGYKFTVLFSILLGAISARLLLRELGFSDASSYLAGIVYAFSIYHLRVLAPEGNFPRFVALNVAPLFLLAFLYVTRRNWKYSILSGLFLAIVGLTHHTLFVSFGLPALFMIPYLWITRKENIRGIAIKTAIASTVAFSISAFWVVPFLLEKNNAHFLNENSIEYLFKFQSVKLEDFLFPTSPWSFYQGVAFYLGIAGVVLLLLKREKPEKALGAGLLGASLTALLLSLGYYGPTPFLNRLPLLNMIPPYRWLDSLSLVGAIGMGVLFEVLGESLSQKIEINAARKSIVVGIFLVFLVILSLSDVRLQTDSLKAEDFPGDYLAVLNYMGNDNSTGWRFYQAGLEITQGSRVSWAPALAGKPALEGWYRQGDPAYPQHSYLNYAIENEPGFAEKALRAYSIKYILTDEHYKGYSAIVKNLKDFGFEEVYSSGSFHLYRWSNFTFLQPKSSVLVVGSWPFDLGVSYEKAEYVDDYADRLNEYSVVILNAYKYRDPLVWVDLEEYVKNGGTLVLNTFLSPDAEATRFGVKSVIVRILGRANLSSSIYNVSAFSNFTYEGQPWTATAYEGDLISLIKLGNYAMLGYKDYGSGRVYFIGLNLPYHSAYTGNEYEAEIIRELLKDYIKPPKVSYAIIEMEDCYIKLGFNLSRSSTVIVSENYYPHWKAYVDGKEVEIKKNEEFGLIEVALTAGNHVLELKFEDPFLLLRYVSVVALIVVVLILGIPERWIKASKKAKNEGTQIKEMPK